MHKHLIATVKIPFSVTVPVEPGARQAELARLLPFIESTGMRDGKATAYLCRDFTCGPPVTDASELRSIITA